MKHNVRRLFCALLAVLMLFSMAGFALADGGTVDIGGGIDGSFGDQPSTPSTSSNIKITFLHGDEFTMGEDSEIARRLRAGQNRQGPSQ